MTGADTLGISEITDPTSPHNGKVPIPPIMDTQLDQVVIQNILTPLRKRVVEKFEKLITPVKREAWWEVYLSAFVILNHIERLARHSAIHARTHTLPVRFPSVIYSIPPPIPTRHGPRPLTTSYPQTEQILQHTLPRSRLPHSQVDPRPLPLCLQRRRATAPRLVVAEGGGHGQVGCAPGALHAGDAGYRRAERYVVVLPFGLFPLASSV